MGIQVYPEIISIMDLVNKLFAILKTLNLTLKFEAGFVAGTRPINAAAVSTLKSKFDKDVPRYAWSDMKVLDKTACPV